MLAWNDSLKRSSVFIEMGRIKRFIKSMKYYREQQEQVLLGSPAASMYRNVSAGLQQLLIVSIHTAIYRKTTLTNTADKWLQRACAAKHFRPAIVNIYMPRALDSHLAVAARTIGRALRGSRLERIGKYFPAITTGRAPTVSSIVQYISPHSRH